MFSLFASFHNCGGWFTRAVIEEKYLFPWELIAFHCKLWYNKHHTLVIIHTADPRTAGSIKLISSKVCAAQFVSQSFSISASIYPGWKGDVHRSMTVFSFDWTPARWAKSEERWLDCYRVITCNVQRGAIFINMGWNPTGVSVARWEYTQYYTYLPAEKYAPTTNPRKHNAAPHYSQI